MTLESAETGGVCQNLIDFTIQVRHRENNRIVGAGFLVSTTKVVTCSHVIRDAGIDPETGFVQQSWSVSQWLGKKRSSSEIDEADIPVQLMRSEDQAWSGKARLASAPRNSTTTW